MSSSGLQGRELQPKHQTGQADPSTVVLQQSAPDLDRAFRNWSPNLPGR